MRKVCTVLTGIFLTLLFITCTQFTADIEDYLSYWSTEVAATDFTLDKPYISVGETSYVSSMEDVIVTIKLRNPKKLTLKMPTSSDKVIRFPGLTTQPHYGIEKDYTLTQTTSNKLTLTYKKDFLQAHEWGSGDIGAEITFIADDNRVFDKRFSMNFKVNTPPPKPDFIVAKTTGTPSYYVLCITVPKTDMQETIAGGLLHKDIKRIDINGTPYSFSVNEAEKKFVKPEADAFITLSDVTKLSEPDADEVPTDGWVLYYKTDVEVKDGAAKKDYTICLADAEGLVSGELKASTKPNKAEAETIHITKGTQISGSGSETNPIIIGTDSAGAELTASSPTENTTVHCTVSEIGDAAPAKYDGNPVTVPLPLNGAGEKKYKLEYYTDGADFTATPVQTVYYRIVIAHMVMFSVDGGNGSLKGVYGTEGKTATTSAQTITVPHGESVTFTATPADGYEVDSWTGVMLSPPNSTTATLSNVTEDKTVTVKFEKMTTINAGSGAWKLLKKAVEIADANAVITINGTIQAANEGSGTTANWGEIVIDKNLTIKKADGAASAVLNANSTELGTNAHRIFKVENGAKLTVENLTLKGGKADGTEEADKCGGAIYAKGDATVNITGCTLTGNTASEKGGGVYVDGGSATFTMKGSSCVTPSTGSEANAAGKNDVYLDNGAKITVAGTLSPEGGIAARITVPDTKYQPGTQVLLAGTGVTLANETYKFAVTPKTVSGTTQNWTVNGLGCLKQSRHTEVPYSQLEACLANASSTEVNHIEITGTIPAADLTRPTGSFDSSASALGEKIKAANPKKVALKLPDGLSDVTSMRFCFAVCRNLISVENIPPNVTDMCCCFFACASLITAPDIPSGVTNMRECFSVCESLTVAPNIPSGVTDMAYCFNSCFKLTQCPDIPSSVTDMERCFRNCEVLERVKINRGYAVGCFYNTFERCTDLQDGGIQVPNGSYNDFTTDSALTNMNVPGNTPAEKKAKFSGF